MCDLSSCPRASRAGNSKLYATFVPAEAPTQNGGTPRGVSVLARDLQVRGTAPRRALPCTPAHPPARRTLSKFRLSIMPPAAAALPHPTNNHDTRVLRSRQCPKPWPCQPTQTPPHTPQSVVLYDSKGTFAGVRRVGSGTPITVEGLEIVVEGIAASSGLELKYDPGVPLVYAGFGGALLLLLVVHSLMQLAGQPDGQPGQGGLLRWGRGAFHVQLLAPPLPWAPPRRHRRCHQPHAAARAAGLCVTTVVSYLSHSQVWAVQAGADVAVGGSSNRAKVGFKRELEEAIEDVPRQPSGGGGDGPGPAQ